MTYDGIFDEIKCKFELERQKKYIKKLINNFFNSQKAYILGLMNFSLITNAAITITKVPPRLIHNCLSISFKFC